MICIIVYKYAFVNSFLNIFTNLFILSLFDMQTSYHLCKITIFFIQAKGKPPVSGRYARVRILFYASFMHNILFIVNWINFLHLSKSFPYYHNNLFFAIVSVKIAHILYNIRFIHRIFMIHTDISFPTVLSIHPSDPT